MSEPPSPARGGRQRIPRPPGAKPGGPPPWAAVDVSSLDLSLDAVREVLAKAGRKERAIETTRKSLELNPTSKNGRAMLERLEMGQ